MTPVPPLAASFSLGDVAALDDEALRTFLRPGGEGVDPRRLGVALQGAEWAGLAARLERLLPPRAGAALRLGREAAASSDELTAARGHVVARLFWPLLYWHIPERYEELVDGEEIDPGLVAGIGLDGRVVADLGAGAGRFALGAARRARRVIAVDAVPALLCRLEDHAARLGLGNVETRRGGFEQLPLERGEVDVAVACSSLGSRPPAGGEAALRSVVRAVRPGGELWVIWPDDPLWFCRRGFHFVQSPPPAARRFRSVAAALSLCRDFYGADAVAWVAAHRSAEVPYRVLGMRPPADACVLRVSAAHLSEDDLLVERPHPGVELRGTR